MLADNAENSLYVRGGITAVDNSQRAGQYALRVAEGDPNPLIANIQSQTTRDTPLRKEQRLNQAFCPTQGFIQFIFMFATRLSQSRLTAATTPSHLRHLLHYLSGMVTPGNQV